MSNPNPPLPGTGPEGNSARPMPVPVPAPASAPGPRSASGAAPPKSPGAQAAPLPPGADPNQPEDNGPHISFWQTPIAQDLIPFAASFFVHLGILILMFLLVPKIVDHFTGESHKEQTVVAATELALGDLGGIEHPGVGDDPTRDAAQDSDPNQKFSEGLNDHKSASLDQSADGGGADGATSLERGPKEGLNHGGGNGGGSGDLNGGGEGGGEARFGPRGGGGGVGPKGMFGGHGGNVKTLIFLCDGSGSMVGAKLEILRAEIKREVATLRPTQNFNVLIFQETDDKRDTTMFSPHLEPGRPVTASKLYDWLLDSVAAHGPTTPIKGLEEAFNEAASRPAEDHPTIYFLTDGEFDNAEGPDDAAVLAKVRELEKRTHVTICTLLFLKDEAEKKDVETVGKLLNQIASETGGTFRIFTTHDF